MQEFPRMLFRGEDTIVVADAEQKAAALAEGYETRWLPCDGPRPEPAACASSVDHGSGRLLCERAAGHAGDHVAAGVSWVDVPQPEPEPEPEPIDVTPAVAEPKTKKGRAAKE